MPKKEKKPETDVDIYFDALSERSVDKSGWQPLSLNVELPIPILLSTGTRNRYYGVYYGVGKIDRGLTHDEAVAKVQELRERAKASKPRTQA